MSVAIPATSYPGSYATSAASADVVAVIISEPPGSSTASRGFYGSRNGQFGHTLPPMASATVASHSSADVVTVSAAYVT